MENNTLSGELWTLELQQVTGVAYAETSVRYVTNRYLELDVGAETYRISQNISADDVATRAPFSDLVIAILRKLHALHPELHVSYGIRGRARWGMFIVGTLSLCAGLALPLAALATGVNGDRLVAATLPAVLLILIGIGFGWSNRPWRPVPRIPLATLVSSLDAASDTPARPPG